MITKDQIVAWLRRCADVLAENKKYLTDLDAAIGDADHGINMDRGFTRVVSQLPGVEDKDIGNILKMAGMALISSVGGAGGPLYGTFFMRAGMATAGKYELTNADVAQLLEAALDGVLQRGKAKLGDKTMVDALTPAVEAFKQTLNGNAETDTLTALEAAVAGAKGGMEATIPLVARKGRASYLGERSAGHQDPGATSSYLLLNALLTVVNEA
ncbi:MAG: dihydroxyacetone kinase subunit L [Anaerolineae bacterium]|nr:dihydroxyacetone kinase subunit L [Anaerolineae bacterium]